MVGSADHSQDAAEAFDSGLPDTKGAPPSGGTEADLARLSAQASALASASSLQDLQALLDALEQGLNALDVSALTPRRGLGGLFDSRARRLKAFRAAYRTTAHQTTELAEGLSQGAGALTARHDALSTLWTELRDAVLAWDAQPATDPEPGGDAVSAQQDLQNSERSADHEPQATAIRTIALHRLAVLRATRNAEHRLPAVLLAVRDGLLAWQAEWEDALGLGRRKPRRVRPDPARLHASRDGLLDHVAGASQCLKTALARRLELSARMPGGADRRSPDPDR